MGVAAPAPSSTSRSSEGRGTVTAGSDHSMHTSENTTDGDVTRMRPRLTIAR